MHTVNLKFINDNVYSQRCLVPLDLLKSSELKPGDVVSIHCGSRYVICRTYIRSPTDLEKSIIINDTVWYNLPSEQPVVSVEKMQLFFPGDFGILKVTSFEQLKIKLIIKNEQVYFTPNEELYQNIAFKLLQQLVICKGAIVNCYGLEVADMFNIHRIIITDTFHEEQICGRLSRTSKIEISEVLFEEPSIEKLELGGVDDAKHFLAFYLFQQGCQMVIVTGPSGCGKSSFVKKFCSDLKCGLVTIDGTKEFNLTTEKYDAYYEYLIQYSKRMPVNNLCFLFIDHLDKLGTSEHQGTTKQGTISNSVSIVVKLLKKLKGNNIYVLATSVQKKLIHPSLACMFQEVSLGVPSIEQRKEILKISLKSIDCSQIDFDQIAAMLPGFVATDILQLTAKVTKKNDNMNSPNEFSSAEDAVTTKDFEQALLSFTPSILRCSEWSLKVQPVHWSDIGGMVKIKERLQMCIEKPLLHPEIFENVGLKCPTGILLFGPPGCCKTTLARGLATECHANFFAANPSQIYSAYVGESEKNISQLFYQARLCAPSIIFLDELDSLVGNRDLYTKQQGVAEKVLSTLLNEMDGSSIQSGLENTSYDSFENTSKKENNVSGHDRRNQVIVVAATNRPDCIDNALLRPGRFDVILYVPPPNYEERVSILQTITKDIPLLDVDLKIIAEKTDLFTGADLKNLYNMVGMNALRQDFTAEYIKQDHFMEALKNIQPSITKDQVQMYELLSTKYGPVISE